MIEKFTGAKGATLHSLQGLKPNFNLTDFNIDKVKFEALGTTKFGKFNIVIVDDASMISTSLHKLNVLRANQYNTRIVYLGDKLQLAPVRENHISTVFDVKYKFNLTDIIRQKKSNPLIELLDLLRNDVEDNSATFLNYIKKNKESIKNNHGYRVVDLVQFKTIVDNSFTSDKFKNNINSFRIGTYTNAASNRWNAYIRQLLTKTGDIISIGDKLMGYKTIVDEFLSPIIINSNDYVVTRVESKLTDDGFKAFEVTIKDLNTGFCTDVYIVDHLDSTFGKYYTKICNLHRDALYGDLIEKGKLWNTYYSYKETFMCMIDFDLVYNNKRHATVKREIDYAYAVTVHKLQGSTIGTIILDVMDICYYNSNKRSPRLNTAKNPNVINTRNRLLYTGASRASEKMIALYY